MSCRASDCPRLRPCPWTSTVEAYGAGSRTPPPWKSTVASYGLGSRDLVCACFGRVPQVAFHALWPVPRAAFTLGCDSWAVCLLMLGSRVPQHIVCFARGAQSRSAAQLARGRTPAAARRNYCPTRMNIAGWAATLTRPCGRVHVSPHIFGTLPPPPCRLFCMGPTRSRGYAAATGERRARGARGARGQSRSPCPRASRPRGCALQDAWPSSAPFPSVIYVCLGA